MQPPEEQNGQDWDRQTVQGEGGGLDQAEIATPPSGDPDWWDDAQADQRSGGGGRFVVVLLLLLVAAAAAWWFLIREPGIEPEAAAGAAEQMAALPERVDEPEETPALPPEVLPDLDDSDGWVRGLAAGVSSHPRFAELLLGDGLIRAAVRLTSAVAYGDDLKLPGALRPAPKGFLVEVRTDGAFASAANARRYDVLVEFLEGVEADGVAELYRRSGPLFEQAHRDLGLPGSFAETARRAMRQLERVPSTTPRLEQRHTSWHYLDPELEAMSPAQKALLRMAPEQRTRVLRALRRQLDAMSSVARES